LLEPHAFPLSSTNDSAFYYQVVRSEGFQMRAAPRMIARITIAVVCVAAGVSVASARFVRSRSPMSSEVVAAARVNDRRPVVVASTGSNKLNPLSEQGQILIRNRAWDSVRVEMRAGPSEDCEANPLVAVRTLKRGRRWKVLTDDNLCWRREMNPSNPTLEWTPWTKRRAGAGGTVAELLQ
jgi:hypothetical protein